MATYSVDVYRQGGGIKLGSGTATGGSPTISSYSAYLSRTIPNPNSPQGEVLVTSTQSGVSLGKTIRTRVITDAGATLTLADKWPFA